MSFELPTPIRFVINAIPDVNQQPPERQATVGMMASIFLHAVVILFCLSVHQGWLEKLWIPPKDNSTLDLVIQTVEPKPVPPAVPLPSPEKVLLPLDQLAEKPRMDSAGLQEAKEAPKLAAFQSDKNLVAGSQQRPTGNAPLPTVLGRKNGEEKSLVKQDAQIGALAALPPKAPSPVAKLSGGNNVPKPVTAAKKPAPKNQPGAETSAMEEALELGGELVFRKLAAGPSSATAKSGPTTSASQTVPPKETPKKVSDEQAVEDLFQEGKERKETKGGLAENGKVGVNASKTPVAAYIKGVSGAIGANWNQLIKNRMDSLETGLVKVRLWVTPDGGVQKVVVERSTANRQFTDLCLEAIRAARLEPPPEEARALLRDGLLEIPFTFSLY